MVRLPSLSYSLSNAGLGGVLLILPVQRLDQRTEQLHTGHIEVGHKKRTARFKKGYSYAYASCVDIDGKQACKVSSQVMCGCIPATKFLAVNVRVKLVLASSSCQHVKACSLFCLLVSDSLGVSLQSTQ